LEGSFYLPTFTEYVEYDFRNLQALENIEDFFWETTYPSAHQEEYLRWQKVVASALVSKQEILYNAFARKIDPKIVLKSDRIDVENLVKSSLPSVPYTENAFSCVSLLARKNYQNISTELFMDQLDDTYLTAKALNNLYFNYTKAFLISTPASTLPTSYATIFDSFRPDYEENFASAEPFFGKSVPRLNLESRTKTFASLRAANPLKLRSSAKKLNRNV